MIRRIVVQDVDRDFRSGVHALDDYFARHALANDRTGVSRCFVLVREEPGLPRVAGFYTLSMASASAESIAPALQQRPPRYPIPVALIGRLAVDSRARGRRFGEALLVDALHRVLHGVGASPCPTPALTRRMPRACRRRHVV
ncbi:MAG: hypothetical protein ACOZNI_14910 [Myxococcota bacterium]